MDVGDRLPSSSLTRSSLTRTFVSPATNAKEVYESTLETVREEEKEKREKPKEELMYEACVKGKISSDEVWLHRNVICSAYCAEYKESRQIGAYVYMNGKKEEVINEQGEACLKYGHKTERRWLSWPIYKEEERRGTDPPWHLRTEIHGNEAF